jgi:signal transduction histidine kinase
MPQARILIVEDEVIAAENIAGRLHQQGYDVVGIVDSGTEAIKQAASTKPDLILMDIMLKGEIDGVAAAIEIYDRWKIPIIYMTAFGDEATLQRAKAAEPFGYLIKPFKPHELRATVEVVLNKRASDLRLRSELEKAEQQRRQAESLNNLKSELVSVLSHEFRTPLSTIYLSTDLLENQGHQLSEEKKTKRYAHIRKAVSRMTALLDDITTIGKSELGKLETNPTIFSLENFCRSLVEDFQELAGESRSLNFINHGSYTNAYLDDKLLHHILHNLLSNAIKYSSQGGIVNLHLECIKESTREHNKPKTYQDIDTAKVIPTRPHEPKFLSSFGIAIFRVQDWGIGIPPEAQSNLFDSFFRAQNVGEVPGYGLGLTVVKNYVDILGGEITVESELGTGSTFTVTLPLCSN